MDLESEKVLKLIFPDGLPENLRDNPELGAYLTKLGSYTGEQLKKEQSRLADETKNVVEQTQDLAIANYKTFIRTAENSRSIFNEFQNAEAQVGDIIEKLPRFTGKCESFLEQSAAINEQRRLNTITLKKNAQLLEVLELPQLMERCIREGRYEEALELAAYVQKMGENLGDILVIRSVVQAVEALWHTMLVQLVGQLRTDLQLPKCLQIVGYLRRMQAFGSGELKLKFLQARNHWLQASLKTISKDDAQQHLTKTIEVTRVHLFNIITQYRAIFPDASLEADATTAATGAAVDEPPMSGVSCAGDRLFQAWVVEKINEFLETLEFDLQRGVSSMETVLGQCMYFGLSFSRVGADFRSLMAPIFVRVIRKNFTAAIGKVNENFDREMEKYTLINKVTLHGRNKAEAAPPAAPASDAGDAAASTAGDGERSESYAPPESLLDFHPLATLCNGYLGALNELRFCAPLALAHDVARSLQQSLELVTQNVLTFYRQEQQAFTDTERNAFGSLCKCYAHDLLPYLQRCIRAIFPEQTMAAHLGGDRLSQDRMTQLPQDTILAPLQHFIPAPSIERRPSEGAPVALAAHA